MYSGTTLPDDVREQLYRGTYEFGERELLGSAVQHSDRVSSLRAGLGIALESSPLDGSLQT